MHNFILVFHTILILLYGSCSQETTANNIQTQATASPEGSSSTETLEMEHNDPRFRKDALYMASMSKAHEESLYILFSRLLCGFNERYDLTQRKCSCDIGWQGPKCADKVSACGSDIEMCKDDGKCVEGRCECGGRWIGADCSTPTERCTRGFCPFPQFQYCLKDTTGNFTCVDSLPLRVQMFTGRRCNDSDPDGCEPLSWCHNGWCSCELGTILMRFGSGMKCSKGLLTCINHKDCSHIAHDVVCRHKDSTNSESGNQFSYGGDGPYCLCADSNRVNPDTGLCIPAKTDFGKIGRHFLSAAVTFGSRYWPVILTIIVLVIVIGLVIWKLNKSRMEDEFKPSEVPYQDSSRPTEHEEEKAISAKGNKQTRVQPEEGGTKQHTRGQSEEDGTKQQIKLQSEQDGTKQQIKLQSEEDGTKQQTQVQSAEDGTKQQIQVESEGDDTKQQTRVQSEGDDTKQRTRVQSEEDGTKRHTRGQSEEDDSRQQTESAYAADKNGAIPQPSISL